MSQSPIVFTLTHSNIRDPKSDIYLQWSGEYTSGDCGARGTTTRFTDKAATAYCQGCKETFSCAADGTAMRNLSVKDLIDEITNGTEEINRKDVAFWDGSSCLMTVGRMMTNSF